MEQQQERPKQNQENEEQPYVPPDPMKSSQPSRSQKSRDDLRKQAARRARDIQRRIASQARNTRQVSLNDKGESIQRVLDHTTELAKALTHRRKLSADFSEQDKITLRKYIGDDIIPDVDHFNAELSYLDKIGEKLFVIQTEDDLLVPVSTSLHTGSLVANVSSLEPDFSDFRRDFVANYSNYFLYNNVRLIEVNPRSDRWFVERQLGKFLKSRFKQLIKMIGRRSDPSGSQSPSEEKDPTGLLPFELTSDTEGLVAYYSPIYKLSIRGNPNRVLSDQRTNQAKGWIPPGMFFFGVRHEGKEIYWDIQSECEVPPQAKFHIDI